MRKKISIIKIFMEHIDQQSVDKDKHPECDGCSLTNKLNVPSQVHNHHVDRCRMNADPNTNSKVSDQFSHFQRLSKAHRTEKYELIKGKVRKQSVQNSFN